jgi:16S rRNA (cytosine1402-N4)-methyltransferase
MKEKEKNFKSSLSDQQAGENPYHVPVLLKEVLDGLNIKTNGVYVDCTFGGGGHSGAILSKLGKEGKLVAFDHDEAAKANLPAGQSGLPVDERVIFVPHNFRHLQRFLRINNVTAVDGILADLGVSSHQFNEAGRGFSTRFDAMLDMRMDQRQSQTAFDVVKSYSEEQLHKIFEQYGEVTNSKTLAKTIVQVRNTVSLKTTEAFKDALHGIVKGNPKKYYAQVFQALRIEVNDELGALKDLLEQVAAVLKPGGRIAIITFHSLEDRMVKNFFRRGSFEEPVENPFINTETINQFRLITKKPVLPSPEEIKQNSRSASAKLRVAEKK